MALQYRTICKQKHAPTIKCHQHVASHNADDGATGEDLYALFLRFAVISTNFRFTCEEKPRNDATYLHLLPLPYHLLQLTGFSHIRFQAGLFPQTLLCQVRVWDQMTPPPTCNSHSEQKYKLI